MMKKIGLLFTMVFVGLFVSVTPAHAFLNNWSISVDGGAANKVLIGELLDITGSAFISNNIVDLAGNGTFKEVATFSSLSHDFATGNYDPNTNNLTATFTGTGNLIAGAAFSFSSGTLNIYSDATNNYGQNTGGSTYFGA